MIKTLPLDCARLDGGAATSRIAPNAFFIAKNVNIPGYLCYIFIIHISRQKNARELNNHRVKTKKTASKKPAP